MRTTATALHHVRCVLQLPPCEPPCRQCLFCFARCSSKTPATAPLGSGVTAAQRNGRGQCETAAVDVGPAKPDAKPGPRPAPRTRPRADQSAQHRLSLSADARPNTYSHSKKLPSYFHVCRNRTGPSLGGQETTDRVGEECRPTDDECVRRLRAAVGELAKRSPSNGIGREEPRVSRFS